MNEQRKMYLIHEKTLNVRISCSSVGFIIFMPTKATPAGFPPTDERGILASSVPVENSVDRGKEPFPMTVSGIIGTAVLFLARTCKTNFSSEVAGGRVLSKVSSHTGFSGAFSAASVVTVESPREISK